MLLYSLKYLRIHGQISPQPQCHTCGEKTVSLVRVSKVDSYDDHVSIKSFIRDALHLSPQVAELFQASDPGRHVVIKPNWIQHSHEFDSDVWEPVMTHPSVVMATVECVAEALDGKGVISVCDAPNTYADFEAILGRGALRKRFEDFRARWPEIQLEALDLRREVWVAKEQVIVERRPNPPDPRGYVALNLGEHSLFYGHPAEGRYYGADYDEGVVNSHHHGKTQEYLLAGTPMSCDLFINLPKLKTHKKVGITCCLKNLVGINGDKNWLPHFVEGSLRSGGDEFSKDAPAHTLERTLKRFGRKVALSVPGVGPWMFRKVRNVGQRVLGDSESVVRGGNWSGNDTCWRMVLDLNRALLYGKTDGTWNEAPATKRYLAIVDGIVGGEGNGPLCPTPVDSRVLLAGTSPASVDAVACRLMGFELAKLPVVTRAFEDHRWPIHECDMDSLEVLDGRVGKQVHLGEVQTAVPGGFTPHFGWTAHLRAAG